MEEKKDIEVLEEKTTKIEKVEENTEVKKNNKNSVVLIFGVLGGLVFMLIIVACIMFLPDLIGGNKTTKFNTKSKDVYSTYRMDGNSLNYFDLAFLKIENNGKNKVYSPLSIKYALAMLAAGSNGESKSQITNVIGDYQSEKYANNDHMSFANAMFIRNSYSDNIKKEYTDSLKEKYNAEVVFDDFKDASKMNEWVSKKTFNLINNLFEQDDIKDADFELTNALAIDMKWNKQLQCATGSDVPCIRYGVTYSHEKIKGQNYQYNDSVATIQADEDYSSLRFNGKEGYKAVSIKAAFNNYDAVKTIGEAKITEEVGKAYREWLETEEGKGLVETGWAETNVDKYLAKYIEELNENYGKGDYSTDFLIYNDDNVKAFAKDLKEYDGTTLQYIGIMPKKDSLKDYIDKVEVSDISNIISGLKEMKNENFKDGVLTLIYGYIPVFDYDYTLDLTSDLKKMGINDVFDITKADLSNMLNKNKGEYISKASHKAKIEFSNDGIKAAAATTLAGAGAAGGGFNYLYEVPTEEIDITFDKPYIYIIRDKNTGEVWFTGSVYEPVLK